MGYTAVPTVSATDVFTANDWETYIRDNFESGVPALFDEAGQLVISSGSGAIDKIGTSSTYGLLTADSGEADNLRFALGSHDWGLLSLSFAAGSGEQEINDSYSKSGYSNQSDIDLWDEATDERFEIATAGYYMVSTKLNEYTSSYSIMSTRAFTFRMKINGTIVYEAPYYSMLSYLHYFSANDYVQFFLYDTDTGSTGTANYVVRFTFLGGS